MVDLKEIKEHTFHGYKQGVRGWKGQGDRGIRRRLTG